MRRRGFSLLEVILVLSVAGVLLALAVPSFSSLRDAAAVRAATGELGAIFSAARHEAISRRAVVAIVIDTAAGSVGLRSGGRTLRRRTLEAMYGVVLGANRDSAVYDPRGLGYGVTNLSVTVRRGSIVDTLTMSRRGRVRW
jgi:prepilin-type N-terminal cleavage/methylation domain-containing protein